MREERVDERLVGIARRRMHGEARRLHDDDEMRVLVQDLERDRLRARLGRPGRRNHDKEALARFDPPRRLRYDSPAARHPPFQDQRFEARARERRQRRGEQLIEPPAAIARAGLDLKAPLRRLAHAVRHAPSPR